MISVITAALLAGSKGQWKCDGTRAEIDFVFRRNWRVHLNRRGRLFSRLLAAELCSSAVVMLDTQSLEVVWRVLATHSIRQFPLHFSSRASPSAITFQLESTFRHKMEAARFLKWYPSTKVHVVASHKSVIFIAPARIASVLMLTR